MIGLLIMIVVVMAVVVVVGRPSNRGNGPGLGGIGQSPALNGILNAHREKLHRYLR
jgi:hypothetical protein